MSDMNDSPVVHADAEKAVPSKPVVKKPTARKPKAGNNTNLSLPTVCNANGTPNLVLSTTMKAKFPILVLVKQTDVNEKAPVQVLENKQLGDLVHFVEALVASYTGGTGIAADGATLYVDQHSETVLKAVPQIKTYDIVFGTAQSGALKNRVPVVALIAMARTRAEYVKQSIKRYGLTKTAHTKKSNTPSTVVLI